MITNKNLTYGVAALVADGVALVAGVPAYVLRVLACPLMMFFKVHQESFLGFSPLDYIPSGGILKL